MFLIEEIFLYS